MLHTDSKKLQISLIDKLFTDINKIYEYDEIKEFSRNELKDNYTDGKLSGVINKMLNKNIIFRLGTGKYKLKPKNDDINANTKHIINQCLIKTINSIENDLSNINAIKLNKEDYEVFIKIKNILEDLKDLKNYE